MPPTPDSLSRHTLCLAELLGKLSLAHADAAQRMQFLVSRLFVGTLGSCLRTQMLHGDDVIHVADRAELESRVSLIVEAGAEGYVSIVRSYMEDVASAQTQCLQTLFGLVTPVAPAAASLVKLALGSPAALCAVGLGAPRTVLGTPR